MNEPRTLWRTLGEMRNAWIGRTTRNDERTTTVMEAKIEAKAGWGRPRTPFVKQIIEDTGRTAYRQPKEVAVTDRHERKGPPKWLDQSKNWKKIQPRQPGRPFPGFSPRHVRRVRVPYITRSSC